MNFLVISGLKSELKSLNNLDVVCGSGFAKKATIITEKLINNKFDCVVSFGFAGGLTNQLTTGETILSKNIVWNNYSINPASKKYLNFFKGKLREKRYKIVDIFSSEKIISNGKKELKVKEKNTFLAVDMESEFIQKIAQKNNIPFIAVRVILDDYKVHIPNFIIMCTNSDGRVQVLKLLVSILRKPKRIFDLLRLSRIYFSANRKLKKLSKLIFEKKLH